MFLNSIGVKKLCVSWKLEITPKNGNLPFLVHNCKGGWSRSVKLQTFLLRWIAKTQLWSLWSESSQKKSVCEMCPNRFCQDDSIQIWNFTNCQFQDMKTYMTLILKKKIMRNKEVPKGSMFMVYFYLHPYTKFQGNAGRYSIHGSIWAWSFVLKDEVVGCRNDACWVWKK